MMLSLDPMLNARSIAVVGASERAGSVGDQTIRQLISGGFEGEVHAVNPRYESVHGIRPFLRWRTSAHRWTWRCWPSPMGNSKRRWRRP